MLTNAQTFFTKGPHLVVMPGLLIVITVLCLYIIGDGIRDAFDPQMPALIPPAGGSGWSTAWPGGIIIPGRCVFRRTGGELRAQAEEEARKAGLFCRGRLAKRPALLEIGRRN
jgi:hypothetical protein